MDLDERSKIPVWWVAAAIPFFVGFVAWMTSVDSKATEAKERLPVIEKKLDDMIQRLIRIEDALPNK